MMKKVISIFLMLSIAISITSSTLLTVGAETQNEFSFDIMDNGTAKITKYNDIKRDIEVPQYVDGIEVTEIGKDAFTESQNITTVIIPKTITNIDKDTFKNHKDAIIYVFSNSYAQNYAEENNINYCFLIDDILIDTKSTVMSTGAKKELRAIVTPSNAENKEHIWSSSNEDVAVVDDEGVVTAKSRGKASIYAKTTDGSDRVAKCDVTVNQQVRGIHLSQNETTLHTGKSKTLKASVTPANANNKDVKWSTTNKKVVSVSDNGVITGKKKGVAKVIATAKDGSKVTANSKITVKQYVTKIKLSHKKATIDKGEKKTLKAKALPTNANNRKLHWSSNNKKVANVTQKGVVTGKKKGNTSIVAKATDGSKKQTMCKITVVQPVNKITLANSSVTVKPNATYKIKATVMPKNANNKALTYSSSNTGVATVDNKGTIKGIKNGTATIYAKAKDGSGVTAKLTVTVPDVIVLTPHEKDMLTRSLYREAGATSFMCQVYVCSATLNLWKSNYSYMSLGQMLTTYNIFSTAYTLSSVTKSEKACVSKAVDYVLNGGKVEGVKYFRTCYYHGFGTPVTNIDNVYFSR